MGAAAVEAEVLAAFAATPGWEVQGPAATEARLAAGGPLRPRWWHNPALVRRTLAAAGLDLLLRGKVRGVTVTLILRAAATGRVVAAARVERQPGAFAPVAERMAVRLRDLAFAALGLEKPVPPPAVAAREPARPPEPTPAPAPPPVPKPAVAAREPEPPAPAPAPKTVRKETDQPSTVRSLVAARLGAGLAHLSRPGTGPGTGAAGGIAFLDVEVFPGRSDFGLELAFESGFAFQSVADLSNIEYLRVRPSALYRWILGPHAVRAGLGYELRQVRARTVVRNGRDHLLALSVSGELRLGETGLRLSPFFQAYPYGGFEGGAGHPYGIAGGIHFYLELSGIVLGLRYRGEFLPGAVDVTDTGLTGSSLNDTVHTLGLFAGYRY